ncbi:MAG: hypothetical protein J0H98_06820 [Solirubrobacterales bacterium]|nr:hypothetical protein [Solirubrobacterales bacterium]
MKKLAVLLVTLLAGFAVTACGSSNSNKEVTSDTLASAMDEVCTETNADFDSLGVRGLSNPAIALEFQGTAEVRQAVIDGFEELNVNDDAQAELDKYVAASEKIIAQDKAIAKAAEDGDQKAMGEAFAAQDAAFKERDKVAKELGTEVCGQTPDIKVEDTGTAPPSDLDAVEPKNTVEEAADQYLKDGISGDCEAINANRHTDAGELAEESCASVKKALVNGKVAGTESYGPVGQAEIVGNADIHLPTYFVTDLDGNLRYGGDAINDQGGLRPAPEGNDAQATAEATVQTIRDNDVDAFNATLPDSESAFFVKGGDVADFSDGKFTKEFVADIKDGDAEPVQLGLNSTWGFYFLEGSKYDWVMAMIHIPGLGGHYRFSGYYPVPKPE